jgi:hypothetical protein
VVVVVVVVVAAAAAAAVVINNTKYKSKALCLSSSDVLALLLPLNILHLNANYCAPMREHQTLISADTVIKSLLCVSIFSAMSS